ncbi:MAG: hypothetical protein JRC86_00745 [Deltaproteobacteria bacterium]|nr:hypothetical protein [Deltaproteobacteria bacterium]
MLYKFTMPVTARTLTYDGKTTAFVHAASEAAALVLLKAENTQDNNVVWDNAVAVVIDSGQQTESLEGCEFNVVVDAPALDVTYIAVANDTFEQVGEGLAILLGLEGMHATFDLDSTHATLFGVLTIATGNANAAIESIDEIVDGGTGYTALDTLTVVGGTSATAATLTVDSVDSQVVDGISIAGAGDYSVLPANPVGVTGGTGGDDATFNIIWDAEQPGAGAVVVAAEDQNGVDITALSMDHIVDEGAATANLTVDIIATIPSPVEDGVEGLY